MATRGKPVGAVLYRAGKGDAADVVYAVAKWRDSAGRQRYRRLGRAWMEPDGSGGWRRRRGAAPEGCLDRRAAERAMDALIDEVETELVAVQPDREATFADAVLEWRAWAEHTKRLKPATLRNYDALLSAPGERPRGGGPRLARIMRAFGERTIASITTADVERFLRGLDREGLPGRSVNAHRQALMNVFEYATRPDSFALPINPVRKTDKRREDYSKPPETFTAEQVLALARAAWEGKHVNGGRRWASKEDDLEQQRSNVQDGAIYTVAGFTGLRQGELRALRWRHVRFADRTLVVVAGMSAGFDSSTKSGKWRAVPLTREAFVALDELSPRMVHRSRRLRLLRASRRSDRRPGAAPPLCGSSRCGRPPAAAVPPPAAHVRDSRDPRPRSRNRPDASRPLEDHDDRALPARSATHRAGRAHGRDLRRGAVGQ